jgi:hypothetical protein
MEEWNQENGIFDDQSTIKGKIYCYETNLTAKITNINNTGQVKIKYNSRLYTSMIKRKPLRRKLQDDNLY